MSIDLFVLLELSSPVVPCISMSCADSCRLARDICKGNIYLQAVVGRLETFLLRYANTELPRKGYGNVQHETTDHCP